MSIRAMAIPFGLALLLLTGPSARTDESAAIPMDSALVADRARRGGRGPIAMDPLEAAIAEGLRTAPSEGDAIDLGGGQRQTWHRVQADGDGWLETGGGGYAYVRVDSSSAPGSSALTGV